MKKEDYNVTITVNATPHEAFNCINSVSKWWTENIEGSSQKLNDEFTVQFGDVHFSKQKLVEIIPGRKVVWLVTDSKLNFVKDKHEWTNTRIIFEVSEENCKTKIRFIHQGLVPRVECYGACSNAWSEYIQHSLLSLISTGKGKSTLKEGKTSTTEK